jgi:hypothetical protein
VAVQNLLGQRDPSQRGVAFRHARFDALATLPLAGPDCALLRWVTRWLPSRTIADLFDRWGFAEGLGELFQALEKISNWLDSWKPKVEPVKQWEPIPGLKIDGS